MPAEEAWNPDQCAAIKISDRTWYLRYWQFGLAAWYFDEKKKILKPAVPSEILFDEKWQPRWGKKGLLAGRQNRRNREQLRRWCDAIPQEYKTPAVQALGHYQFAALEACQQHRDFLDFIEQEHRTGNLNFIKAVWTLHRHLMQPTAYRLLLNHRLLRKKRAAVIRLLTGISPPKSFFRIIARCSDNALDEDSLWLLLNACSHKAFVQNLTPLKNITNPALTFIWRDLPQWLWHPQILACMMELPAGTGGLIALFPPAVVEASGDGRKRVLQSLCTAKNLRELEQRLHNLSFAFKLERPFPAPPFAGTAQLRPVTSGNELVAEGKYMHNCVAGYTESVLRGKHYFYHFTGPEEATVLLRREEKELWVVTEHLGLRNSRLKEKTLVALYRELEKMATPYLFLAIQRLAGFYYHKTPELWQQIRKRGVDLELQHEPNNPYDAQAVAVYLAGVHAGYVPRIANYIPHLLLKNGFALKARVLRVTGGYENAEVLLGIQFASAPVPLPNP
ncbi:MAG: PcfJ domain-containing protein [Turneriella sp.]|nr:PcfJ domain-containing protein [Turneriella sp.]